MCLYVLFLIGLTILSCRVDTNQGFPRLRCFDAPLASSYAPCRHSFADVPPTYPTRSHILTFVPCNFPLCTSPEHSCDAPGRSVNHALARRLTRLARFLSSASLPITILSREYVYIPTRDSGHATHSFDTACAPTNSQECSVHGLPCSHG
jgi:hypothetical protein